MKLFKKIMVAVLIVVLSLVIAAYLFQLQKSFGGKSEGKRMARILHSPNYKDGAFQNLSPTEMMAKDASYFKLFKMYLAKANPTEPKDSLPSVVEDYTLPVHDNVEVSWFGHSTYLIRFPQINILMDPVFSERASPVNYAGSKAYPGAGIFKTEMLPRIDYIMISHDHYDHLDYPTILHFIEAATKFIVPLGVGAHLEHWGIPEDRILELDWWEQVQINDHFSVISTPARHFSGRKMTGRNQTLWTSYVIDSDKGKIYLGGDSGYDKHFKEIGERFGPFDLAILECGQYNSYWPYIHMMPEQTAQAAVDLKTKVLLPVHWSKFTLALHPWNEPIQRVIKQAALFHLPLTTPMLGETFSLQGPYPQTDWWKNH